MRRQLSGSAHVFTEPVSRYSYKLYVRTMSWAMYKGAYVLDLTTGMHGSLLLVCLLKALHT